MGIDPGTNYMGYGILEIVGGKPHPLILGDIDLHKIGDAHQKLRYIFERVQALVREYHPTEVAFESPFFGTNVQSMLKLGRAQGVAIAAVLNTEEDIAIAEYAPTRIKQAITGRGQASKQQIAAMINSMLQTDYQPRRLDATDGMAVALCHWLTTSNTLTRLTAGERRKGLGGDSKARKGSSSWSKFVEANPERIKR
ncbi:MAG: crossover junction endodeoxyribonuclease RuvC [Alistipes sp.]|jgi:crossover junction endodeoxyribonuclease RuvC|nr:crossover junction endodeoxyribonuclease RuvC [Alistipes sp.]MBO5972783.1 crossover junction endodeoxyribonuclease RuvC [Alistipes sp.]